MDMPEKIPAITAYQQALNAYNPDVYSAHKKITAEEWNALMLSLFAQGNRQEHYLEQIINGHLTEFVETINDIIDSITTLEGDVQSNEGRIGDLVEALAEKYSHDNPPPYPVTAVNGKTGNVVLKKADVGLTSVLDIEQIPRHAMDNDPTLSANSDERVPTQQAVKSYTYSKEQITDMIGGGGFDIIVLDEGQTVEDIPVEEIRPYTFYLVPVEAEQMNYYDEYMYINGAWELIGSTRVDLSEYARKNEVYMTDSGYKRLVYDLSVPMYNLEGKQAATLVSEWVRTGRPIFKNIYRSYNYFRPNILAYDPAFYEVFNNSNSAMSMKRLQEGGDDPYISLDGILQGEGLSSEYSVSSYTDLYILHRKGEGDDIRVYLKKRIDNSRHYLSFNETVRVFFDAYEPYIFYEVNNYEHVWLHSIFIAVEVRKGFGTPGWTLLNLTNPAYHDEYSGKYITDYDLEDSISEPDGVVRKALNKKPIHRVDNLWEIQNPVPGDIYVTESTYQRYIPGATSEYPENSTLPGAYPGGDDWQENTIEVEGTEMPYVYINSNSLLRIPLNVDKFYLKSEIDGGIQIIEMTKPEPSVPFFSGLDGMLMAGNDAYLDTSGESPQPVPSEGQSFMAFVTAGIYSSFHFINASTHSSGEDAAGEWEELFFVNAEEKAKIEQLKNVATTGSYYDLDNLPEFVPQVSEEEKANWNGKADKEYVDSMVIKQPDKTYVLYHATAGTNNLYLSAATYEHTYAVAGAYLITISGTGSSATVDWGDGTSDTVDFTGGFNIDGQADKDKYIEVHLGTNCAVIGAWAFYNCTRLTSITIPNSVTSIGERAFRSCSGLTSITIPNSVTSIGAQTFYYCSGLTSITIPNSVTSISTAAFSDCRGLTSVTIPDSVTSIGSGAFSYCSRLPSITIPNSVTSIGDGAFFGCIGLTSINFMGSTLPTIDSDAFSSCRIADIIAKTSSLADSAATAITTAGGTLLTNYRKLY